MANHKGFYWNPSLGILDENCLNGVSVVINLAGSSIAKRWTKSYKNEIVESRVLSLQMLYQLLKKNKGHQVRQLVTASAIGIYPHSYTHYYTEDEKIQETDFLSEVVIKWEEAAQAFNQLGISVADTSYWAGFINERRGNACHSGSCEKGSWRYFW